MELQDLFVGWTSLVGFAALIAVIVNVLKTVGVVKDGTAQTWSAGLNLAGLVAMFVLRIFRPDFDLAGVDEQAAQLANVVTVLLAYITQLLSSKLAHIAVKTIPVIGKSYSQK